MFLNNVIHHLSKSCHVIRKIRTQFGFHQNEQNFLAQ